MYVGFVQPSVCTTFGEDVAVGQHRAFRRAGRAAGVLQDGEVVRPMRSRVARSRRASLLRAATGGAELTQFGAVNSVSESVPSMRGGPRRGC